MKALHGGDLQQASKRFDVPFEQWIDLSTGINPEPYPITDVDSAAFQQLPYLKPDFIQAAHGYYLGEDNAILAADNLLAVSGSQAVIQLLPVCLPSLPVLLPELGYQEHRLQWLQSGAKVSSYPSIEYEASVSFINQSLQHNSRQHLVIINPNNPSGLRFSPAQLKAWANKLDDGAYLIIDEAFIDTQPELSVLRQHFQANMIVLRSFGKFFGLAGLRLGFVFAHDVLIQALKKRLGLWAINGPAQSIATAAFKDKAWQQQARNNINKAAQLSQTLFHPLFNGLQASPQGVNNSIHEALFSSYYLPINQAEKISQFFANRGILLRVIDVNCEYALLRIGCINPKNNTNKQRVQETIDSYIAQLVE
ncbi:MAG: cobalamin biosynthetic protein CobC [Oleiphilaceae bacterium]|jgi:cobalamin biosynthetic protein CobC